jgi:hypothetical protein
MFGRRKTPQFRCSKCGKKHSLEEMAYVFEAPLIWDIVGDERLPGSRLGGETCELVTGEDTYYFIKANLDIPIRGQEAPLRFTVWGSLSEQSYGEAIEHWDNPLRAEESRPYFSFLANNIPGFPDSASHHANVITQDPGIRPLYYLKPTDHPLSQAQENGLCREDFIQLWERHLHPE